MENLPAEIIYNLYQLLDYASYSSFKTTSKYINECRPSLLNLHKLKFKSTLSEIRSIKYYTGVYPQTSKDMGNYSVIVTGGPSRMKGVQLSCREYKNISTLAYYSSHKVIFSDGRMACMDVLTMSKNRSKITNWNNKWNIRKNNKYTHYYYNRFYITCNPHIDIRYVSEPLTTST
jgi:hypothetical protein